VITFRFRVVGKDVPHLHIHFDARYHNSSLHGWKTHHIIQMMEENLLPTKLKTPSRHFI